MKIIEFLTQWLREIVLVFIFTSIVELILPNGYMKKYINMVIGFLIILVIIGPFVKLIHTDYSFARNLYKNQIESINFKYNEDLEINKVQDEQIKDFYINKVKGEIQELVLNTTDYVIESIDITIKEDEMNFGKLEEVNLILKENLDGEKENQIAIKEVVKVSIGKDSKIETEYEEISDDKLKKKISETYDLPTEKIKILIKQEGR